MNFLAHLVLAEPTAHSRIGNLAGDFVKGRLGDELPRAIRRGIVEHRRIDTFTDTHPQVGELRRIIGATHGHYSRVIGDIFLDHFLVRHFDEMTGQPLPQFLADVWESIDPHQHELPGMLRRVYPRMRDERWIEGYGDVEGIRVTLRNVSYRFKRRPDLASATPLLDERRAELAALFHAFFPDVQRFAQSLRD
jgi:acyl carrier protein phosphodiesterase